MKTVKNLTVVFRKMVMVQSFYLVIGKQMCLRLHLFLRGADLKNLVPVLTGTQHCVFQAPFVECNSIASYTDTKGHQRSVTWPYAFFCSRNCCLYAVHQLMKELRHTKKQKERKQKTEHQRPKKQHNHAKKTKTSTRHTTTTKQKLLCCQWNRNGWNEIRTGEKLVMGHKSEASYDAPRAHLGELRLELSTDGQAPVSDKANQTKKNNN